MAKAIFFCVFISLLSGLVHAQSQLGDEGFLEKLALCRNNDLAGLLFVHTDKTLYTNNEDIWFSAYLLRGYLVEGREGLVGWEAKTADGRPLSVTGILYEDGDPIDTLSGNSCGMGSFSLRPDKSKEYAFKITKNDFLNQDTLYKLPAAIDNGVVLRLKNAVVEDTLKMELYSKQPRKVQILLHNYREGYASFSVRATP